MTGRSIEEYRRCIHKLATLVEEMDEAPDFGHEWAEKAHYLLDDMQDYLDTWEDQSDA